MAALAQARMGQYTKWLIIALPLGPLYKAFLGGIACADTANANVAPGAAGSTTLVRIGEFIENIDNSAATNTTAYVNVALDKELMLRWYDSVTGTYAVTTANLFATAYMADDHTLTMSASGNSKAGVVWAVDAVKGVAVGSVSF